MRTLIVVIVGLLSTALALAGVSFTIAHGTNLMGYHWMYVLPVGAFLVGLVASTGFGLGAWLGGRRVDGWLFGVVAASLLIGYFGAEYLVFKSLFPGVVVDDNGAVIGFWGFFDLMSRAIHFGNKDGLGLAGYLFRATEIVGFVVGGLGASIVLRERPYCRQCSRYLRRKIVAFVEGGDEVAAILAQRASGPAICAELQARAPVSRWGEVQALPRRHLLRLGYCAACFSGSIYVEALAGLPDQRAGRVVEVAPIDPQVTRALNEVNG